jgi:outer membrane lipoprotein LolB
MKKLSLLLLLLFPLVSLIGCSTTTSQESSSFTENGRPLGTHYLTRPQRQAQLLAINSWTAQGNLAVHTDQKGWNASFNWQQQGGDYTLALFGPLGSNRVQLSGNPQQVVLQTGSQTYSAATPEELVQQRLGWEIPVTNLYYWLRGAAAPNVRAARKSYDTNNHLVQLDQQGWHIVYLRYLSVNGVDLPSRILLSNARMQANIIITGWNINQ